MLLVILCILVPVLWVILTWNFTYFKSRGFPEGPKPSILIGSTPGKVFGNKHEFYDIDKIYKSFKGQAPFVGFFSMMTPKLLILEPLVAVDILTTHFLNFRDNEEMGTNDNQKILSSVPSLLRGEVWREKREEIEPAYSMKRIKALHASIENISRELSLYIEKEISKTIESSPKDAVEMATKYTIDIISKCIFNLDSTSFSKSNDPEIRKMAKQLNQKSCFGKALGTILPFLRKSLGPAKLENYFTSLVKKEIEDREEDNFDVEDYLEFLIAKKKRNEITDTDIASHGITFFIDGLKTTSNTLAYALYEIARNPRVQEKLRLEIDSKMAETGELSLEKVHKMTYLDQVFKEVLRMHPPITSIYKTCTDPIELDGINHKKVHISKGLTICIPIMNYHHDPEYFDEPEDFIPERFGSVNKFIDKGVYLPFGIGKRACLGQLFAEITIKSALIQIIKHFNVTVNTKTVEPITLHPKILLNTPKYGLLLDFKSII